MRIVALSIARVPAGTGRVHTLNGGLVMDQFTKNEPVSMFGCQGVSLIFNFTNPHHAALINLARIEDETLEESVDRKAPPPRIQGKNPISIKQTAVTMVALVTTLLAAGYAMKGAWLQKRINRRKPTSDPARFYAMIRFDFIPVAGASEIDPAVSKNAEDALALLTEWMHWDSLNVYENPLIEGNVVLEGKWLSLNPVGCIPLRRPTGELVVARKRNAEGRQVGEPVPLEASYGLLVEDGYLQLLDLTA